MSENIRKPQTFKKPFDPIDPITPTHLTSEDERLLWDIRMAALSRQETSEMKSIDTSGSMRKMRPPHTPYTISSNNSGIFGEIQNAVCFHICTWRHLYPWNFPKGILLPTPLYQKLEFHVLTPQPFKGTYLFIVPPMTLVYEIPVSLDKTLSHDTIVCLLS